MNLRNRLPLLVLLIIFVGVAVVALANRPTVADANIALPPGYQIEAVATGLTFPTAITWDDQRNLYVAEAGYAYGPKEVGPGRILRITNGHKEIVYDNLSSPVTDIKVYQGEMYIAHKGFLSVIRDGQRKDLITGLPWGDHFTCSIAFDEQGYIYLGNGTATNAGVVGEDNFRFGWAASFPDQRDIPAKDIFLTGQNYASLDLRTAAPNDKTSTGPYMPFGTESTPDQVVHGKPEASGVVLRIKPDGSDLQVYAWGLRNPFGMGFDANGRLVVVDQGYDDRGVRPIANAPDPIYIIEQDAWYGWPDYAAGIPINDPAFQSANPGWPPSFVMKEHPPVTMPVLTLPSHTAAMKFDFAPEGFDTANLMYLAAFGSGDPVTGVTEETTGSQILTVNIDTGEIKPFAYNKSGKPAGRSLSGFNRPVDVKFGPDSCLYIVDFGILETHGQVPNAIPNTGVIWKICKQRTSYKQGSYSGDNVIRGDNPWEPDYTQLVTKLEEFISGLPGEWGLYFKDLTSGNTFGISEELPVPAASTVKVPVVLYAANLVSQGKLSWNERLTYYAWRDWRGGAGSLQFTAKDGDSYSIRELAEKSITESDNVAWKMLERRLGLANIADFMRQLRGLHVYPDWQNISTPKDLVTYMQATLDFAKTNPEHGEDILYWLSNTIWNTGLNRYIDEVTVGHKEGDLTGVANDVGIIYANHPYLLAIMSTGQDDVELGFEYIGQISRIIYDYQVEQELAFGKEPSP